MDLGPLIPIVAILTGMLAIWTAHQRKMRQIELNANQSGNGTGNDISQELAAAIKEEFARLRAENAELRARIERMEHMQEGQLTPAQMNEIAKQVQSMQSHT